ncbi:putative transcription factor MADS-type1 family [Lupinus albus]|uniref:Putative transcription factor MADS-type1 family n=1 Tax=Lupinus albus TaxID=3870 RepID=A0A6A4P362_LUPAL|nr:putative transcription factor MADS-type1 family [Lupinus albus]
MSSSSNNTTTTKCNKRKIKIKKVEPNNKCHVTFTKRKLGLFNKVTELSILCQAETALILSSQQGKLYTCGYPDPDAVIRRFLTNGTQVQRGRTGKRQQQELVETLRLEYEETHNMLQQEKKKLDEIKEAQNGCLDFPAWWNKDIEKMGLEELENFMASLEILKLNLVATAEARKFNSSNVFKL